MVVKLVDHTQPGERFDSLVLVELTHSPFFVVHFYDDLLFIHPSITYVILHYCVKAIGGFVKLFIHLIIQH